jgi:2-polyprenyl-3-methyl-5-hydroxy-6-metoxy-1,4-benzoquinol methylase
MTTIDTTRLESFMGQMLGHMTGSAVCFGVWLGDELGLYRALADSGPLSADDVASATDCHPRLVREWLDGQTAGGLIDYDSTADTYQLSTEGAMALADDESPVFVARGMNALRAFYLDLDKVADAFRGDGALSWGDHHPCLFSGIEWFFRTGYRAMLSTEWIPALDGVHDKLVKGAKVADIGCGHGASSVIIADAYPETRVYGFDFHRPSIETARARAEEAGVADRTSFEVADATSYSGPFDLICFFDCLHDLGDPVGAARHARKQLAPGGTVLLAEPFAMDGRSANLAGNPAAALLYNGSTAACTPNSLSQDVGLALGAQAGEARLRQVFEEAGFSQFRRAAETPLNLILEARV